MKKYIFLIIFFLIASPCYATNYCNDSSAKGCWLFEEGSGTSVDDSTSNSNSGSFRASGEPAWDTTDVSFGTSGSAPNSVHFDASNDYIGCGSDASLDNLSPVSYTLWFNMDAVPSGYDARLLMKGDVAARLGRHIIIENGTKAISFYVNYDSGASGPSRGIDITTGSGNYSFPGWHHLAVTWDGTNQHTGIKIYIDGVEATYDAGFDADGGTTMDSDSDGNLYIGNSATFARTFDGLETDIGVFNRVLSSTEIQAIYNYGLKGTSSPSIQKIISIE